ncbi:MAG: hypothetical protein JNL79_04055 [Myxococcales bacterium]|nr:hypothetical protein [Myxococcales bacterium]
MARTRHDLEGRALALDRHPGDARGAEIVHGHPLARRVVAPLVEFAARDAGVEQVTAQNAGELAFVSQAADDVAAAARLGVHGLQERQEGGLEVEGGAGAAGLGRLLDLALAVDAAADLDGLALKVHVLPPQGLELGGSQVDVHADRVVPAAEEGHGRGRHEGQELRRVEVHLLGLDAAVGAADLLRGVVVAHAQLECLAAMGVVERLGDGAPHVGGRLPAELSLTDLGVELLDDLLEVAPGDLGHWLASEDGQDVDRQVRLRGLDALALLPPEGEPAVVPILDELAGAGARVEGSTGQLGQLVGLLKGLVAIAREQEGRLDRNEALSPIERESGLPSAPFESHGSCGWTSSRHGRTTCSRVPDVLNSDSTTRKQDSDVGQRSRGGAGSGGVMHDTLPVVSIGFSALIALLVAFFRYTIMRQDAERDRRFRELETETQGLIKAVHGSEVALVRAEGQLDVLRSEHASSRSTLSEIRSDMLGRREWEARMSSFEDSIRSIRDELDTVVRLIRSSDKPS